MAKHSDFYASTYWRKLRKVKLRNDPFCQICNKAYANEVHHIIPIDKDYDLRLEYDNLQSTCKPCHSRETRKEMRKNNIQPSRKKQPPGKILNMRYAFDLGK